MWLGTDNVVIVWCVIFLGEMWHVSGCDLNAFTRDKDSGVPPSLNEEIAPCPAVYCKRRKLSLVPTIAASSYLDTRDMASTASGTLVACAVSQ